MPQMLIFGLGYTAGHIARALRNAGWDIVSTGSAGTIGFDDAASVRVAIAQATHVLSSVPPVCDGDSVLNNYGDLIAKSAAVWTGYLSSTGVYGDSAGAWIDESSPIAGRRANRNRADQDWLARGAHVFRLPGIYGPGRSAIDRVIAGKARRIDLPDQVFSRVHVDDIVSGVIAAFKAPAGAYNLADDLPCSQNRVIEAACDLTGTPWPQLQSLDDAALSPMALAFYAENRRVANGKAKRLLGWQPRYPTYVEGLRAVSAMISPAIARTPPAAASKVQ